MAEKNAHKGVMKKLFGGLGLVVLAVFLIGMVYLAAVLLSDIEEDPQKEWLVEEEQAPVTPMTAASDTDASRLAGLFGAPLPALRDRAMQGTAQNDTYDGQAARVAALDYQGFLVSAVRPASAAPLLLRPDLSLSLRTDLSVLNMPAALAQKDGRFCLYFSDASAAYSVYGEGLTEEEFLALAARLQWARP